MVSRITFQDKLKVLPIGGYDMILGMDWLEEFSPMWIDWRRKKLRFAQMGKRITLVGVKEEIKSCEQVTCQQLKGMLRDGAMSQVVQLCAMREELVEAEDVPDQINEVITEFQYLFREPTELPPHRQFDHRIPLLPNVKPVNVKDEIEKQVAQMLHQGIIQTSVSPFTSPVLLVKKKYGSWRFCIDYRICQIFLNNLWLRKMPVTQGLGLY